MRVFTTVGWTLSPSAHPVEPAGLVPPPSVPPPPPTPPERVPCPPGIDPLTIPLTDRERAAFEQLVGLDL
ncbi:hypothetical protein [Actinocrispum sp. NPDC049592]|uniref:hypothetical protein n=1 Tax=Actinocrispum sp. NPDC049592 TaxID=3154835 RepID=UPI00342A774C